MNEGEWSDNFPAKQTLSVMNVFFFWRSSWVNVYILFFPNILNVPLMSSFRDTSFFLYFSTRLPATVRKEMLQEIPMMMMIMMMMMMMIKMVVGVMTRTIAMVMKIATMTRTVFVMMTVIVMIMIMIVMMTVMKIMKM